MINYDGIKIKLHMIGRKYDKLGREEKLYKECWRNLMDRHHKEQPRTLYIGEISPTRCNNCVFYSQWLYSTCFG